MERQSVTYNCLKCQTTVDDMADSMKCRKNGHTVVPQKKMITLAKSEQGRVWHVVEKDPETGKLEAFCSHGGDEMQQFNNETAEKGELRMCAKCYDRGAHDKLDNIRVKFRGFKPKVNVEELNKVES